MGLRDWLKKTRDEFDQAAYYFELGCEVMGEPRSNSLQERSARIAAGKREDARRKEERRRQLEGRWTSRFRSNTGKIDVLLDKSGNPTNTSYPHVHVAYNQQENKVRVILSLDPRNHPTQEVLPGDASGNQVNEAIRRISRMLP